MSITATKSGYYRVKVSKNGIVKETRVKSLEYAKATEKRFIELIEQEEYISQAGASPEIEVKQAVKVFLNQKLTDPRIKIRPTSVQRLEYTFNNHILNIVYKNKPIASMRLIDVTSEAIQYTLDKANTEAYSYSQIKKIYECWNMTFKFSLSKRWLKYSPMAAVQMPREQNIIHKKKELKIYSYEDFSKLRAELENVKKYRYGHVVLLAASTGLRESELCGLERKNIDIENERLYVEKQVVYRNATELDGRKAQNGSTGKIKELAALKTKQSVRYVPLTPRAIELIELIYKQFNSCRTMLIKDANDELLLPTHLNKTLRRAVNACGIEYLGGMHTMRDFFASVAFDEGVPIEVVSRWLGHKNTRVTEEHYISILEGKQKTSFEILKRSGKL